MNTNQRILQLMESMLDSKSTPEEACADCPELLPAVKQRWKLFRGFEAQVEAIFPSSVQGADTGRLDSSLFRSGLPVIPGYEIAGVLGRGGMGVVYRARHLRLNRMVALKMLVTGIYASRSEVARFTREAKLIAALRHPHLVQVYDVGEADGCPYFTMELVEGGNLGQSLAGVPQAPSYAARTAATLAMAVQAAHDGGIVHRDLKPSNVLLANDGTPKISDFGLARRLEDEPDLTMSGARIGTPSYMAPEQFTNRNGEVGPVSDIYSLGAILYEMLTGRPPFRADTVADTERQLVNDDPARPSRLNSKVPRDLETVCLKCLHKDPARRFATAKMLADDLCRFLDGEPITARPVGACERVIKWAQRRRALAALIALSVTVITSLTAVLLWQLSDGLARTRAVRGDIEQALELERRGEWGEARTQYLRAAVELGTHGPLVLRRQVDEGNRDLDLAARLDSVQLDHSDAMGTEREFDHGATYDEVFKRAGIDMFGADVSAIAARIKRSPIRLSLESAIDYWVTFSEDKSHFQRLLVLARACVDKPSDWAGQVSDPRNWTDIRKFSKLTETAEIKGEPLPLLILAGRHFDNLGGDSIPFLTKVQQEYPNDFDVNFILGNCELKVKDNADALRYFQAAVAARPAAAIAENNLGFVLQKSGQTQEAVTHFRRAVKLGPSLVACHHSLAMALCDVGQNAEAIQEAHRAVDLAPNDSYLHVVLGHCLEAAGQTDLAMSEYHRALALNPVPGVMIAGFKSRGPLTYEGTLEQRQADWKACLDSDPERHEQWNGYAELCLYLGKEDEYRRTRRRLLDRFGDTGDPRTAERTGQACLLFPATEEETRQAVALIDQAVATDKSTIENSAPAYFQFAKGLAEYRQGRFENAIVILQGDASKVLGAAPKLIVAMAQFRLGEIEEARSSLASAEILFDWSPDHATDADAWICHVLRRQAEAMILPASLANSSPYRIQISKDNGRFTQAVEQSQLAVKLSPREARLHQLLSVSLEAAGKLDESNAQWQQAFSLDPKLATDGIKSLVAVKGGGHLEQNWQQWKTALAADPPEHKSWSGYAELCLYLGHVDEYRSVRKKLLDRFGDTIDPRVAERTGRACLLMPASDDQTRKAVGLIDRAITFDNMSWVLPFFQVAKALAEYRQGHMESAIGHLQGDASGVLGPMPKLIVAMAQYRLGKTDESRNTLATALRNFDWVPDHATNADAWMYHVLRREAEAMIRPSPAPSTRP